MRARMGCCRKKKEKPEHKPWYMCGGPYYTEEELDIASESDFLIMLYRFRVKNRIRRYYRSGVLSKPVMPVHPESWKMYHLLKKEMEEKASSSVDVNASVSASPVSSTSSRSRSTASSATSDLSTGSSDSDDDLTEVESLPSPVDVPSGGLNVALLEDKAGFEGMSSDPLAVGTEGITAMLGSAVDPMNIGGERTLDVDEGLQSEPLDVSAVGPECNLVVHQDSPFDPLKDENASLRTVKKKMANLSVSAARIPIKKKKKKKKIAAFSHEKIAAIVERLPRTELTSLRKEMLDLLASFGYDM